MRLYGGYTWLHRLILASPLIWCVPDCLWEVAEHLVVPTQPALTAQLTGLKTTWAFRLIFLWIEAILRISILLGHISVFLLYHHYIIPPCSLHHHYIIPPCSFTLSLHHPSMQFYIIITSSVHCSFTSSLHHPSIAVLHHHYIIPSCTLHHHYIIHGESFATYMWCVFTARIHKNGWLE